jgi:hypothetical protein
VLEDLKEIRVLKGTKDSKEPREQ